MKVGLILPSNIWFAPFVNIYIRVLEEYDIKYDIISWNKDGSENNVDFQFEQPIKIKGNLIKFWYYFQYANFVKRKIKYHKFDKLIVFCPQIAIFINGFLKKYYKGRYIFDYRDLSIEQKWYFKHPFLNVLKNSFANVISSPGFKRCLPNGFEYLLSHNFDINAVRNTLNGNIKVPILKQNEKINVLTIGGIRDYSSNIEVVKALANKERIHLQFVGKGAAAGLIEDYTQSNEIKNIEFEGFYPKEKEAGYIQQASFLNIYYPRVITHDTALSNRFYNALIYRKPMIVTTDTTQGDYVEKYQLGLSLETCDNLDTKLKNYLMTFDYDAFSKRCDELLFSFLEDYRIWENRVKMFLAN